MKISVATQQQCLVWRIPFSVASFDAISGLNHSKVMYCVLEDLYIIVLLDIQKQTLWLFHILVNGKEMLSHVL